MTSQLIVGLAALLAGALAQSFTPDALLGQSFVTFRVDDQTSSGGSIFVNGVPTSFQPSSLNYTFAFGATTETTISASAQYTQRSTNDAASGSPSTAATVRIYWQNSGVQLCSVQVAVGVRTTVVVSAPLVETTGTCSVQSGMSTFTGSCSLPAQNIGTKTVGCVTTTEYVDAARSCAAVGIRLRRRDKRCQSLRIKRPGACSSCVDGANEDVYLKKHFLSTDSPGATTPDVTLTRANAYTLELGPQSDTTLTGLDTARGYEVTITDSSASVASFSTGFFKILNAAHRETLTLVGSPPLNENSDVAIEANGLVYHYEDNVVAGSARPSSEGGYYELPVGTYQVRVFMGSVSRGQIYGTQLVPMNSNYNTVAVTTTLTLAANEFKIVILRTASAPFTSVTAQTLDVTPTLPTPLGQTTFIHNELSGDASLVPTTFRLAVFDTASSSSRCALVGAGQLAPAANSAFFSVNTLNDAPFAGANGIVSRVVKFGDSGATCSSFTDTGLPSLTLADVQSPACSVKHVFLLGRTFKFNDTTPFTCSAPGGCLFTGGSSSATATCARLVGKYGDLSTLGSGAGADQSSQSQPGTVQQVTISVPTCQCDTPATVVCNPSNCDLLKKLEDNAARIDAVVPALTTAVNSNGQLTRALVQKTKKACENNGDDIDEARDDIDKLDNKLDDVDKKLNDVDDNVNNVEDDLDNVADDVKKIKKATVAP